jgi:hypothetical protein
VVTVIKAVERDVILFQRGKDSKESEGHHTYLVCMYIILQVTGCQAGASSVQEGRMIDR